MSKRRSKYGPRIGWQFVPHRIEVIRILRELSLAARRILDCLEIEHCRHGGRENGNLLYTYDDFERFVQRSCIRPALDELLAAGLIEITRPGRRSYADLRVPSMYRLTYLWTFQNGKWIEPTNEWKKQKTRPESTTGNGQLPDRNPPLRGANYQTGIHHSYLDLGEEGGGGAADFSGLPASPPAPSQGGMGPSAPSPHFPDEKPPSLSAPSSGGVH
jgi:hypothetical protein